MFEQQNVQALASDDEENFDEVELPAPDKPLAAGYPGKRKLSGQAVTLSTLQDVFLRVEESCEFCCVNCFQKVAHVGLLKL